MSRAAAGRAGSDAASRSLLGQARELRAAIPTQDSVEAPVTAFLSEREVEVAEREPGPADTVGGQLARDPLALAGAPPAAVAVDDARERTLESR